VNSNENQGSDATTSAIVQKRSEMPASTVGVTREICWIRPNQAKAVEILSDRCNI